MKYYVYIVTSEEWELIDRGTFPIAAENFSAHSTIREFYLKRSARYFDSAATEEIKSRVTIVLRGVLK